jgi:hypothetical protein
MDPGLLRSCRCWSGGGTRIVLDLDEYRVSADLDFLVSEPQGYAEIRDLVRRRGASALFVPGTALRFPREPITDQYGVRFPVQLPGGEGGSPLKVEIVREARIELAVGDPGRRDYSPRKRPAARSRLRKEPGVRMGRP